jgi:hypothetical protein
MSMGKARLTFVMLSSKEEKFHQKPQLRDELDQWPRRDKATSFAIGPPLEFRGKEVHYKGHLSKERV